MRSSTENLQGRATVGLDSMSLGPLTKLYPETRIAGFPRNDQQIVFFIQAGALLEPHMTVLDFGAGRGNSAEWPFPFERRPFNLKDKCAKVIGFDVDPVIRTNSLVGRAAERSTLISWGKILSADRAQRRRRPSGPR